MKRATVSETMLKTGKCFREKILFNIDIMDLILFHYLCIPFTKLFMSEVVLGNLKISEHIEVK